MTPFETYRDYIAVVRHFTTDYDYARYNGKVRVLRKTFDARSDKYWFEKIADHHDPHWLIVANLVDDPRMWVGDIAKGTARYAMHKGRVEALEYNLRRDLECMSHDAAAEMTITSHSHPVFARRCLAGEVCVESAAAISAATGCGSLWRKMTDPVLREIGTRLDKYATFVNAPVEKVRSILKEHFCDGSHV